MKLADKLKEKKVYQAPQLVKYGSLTEMTAGHHVRGMLDNGSKTTRTG
jgi:hypothetical protein